MVCLPRLERFSGPDQRPITTGARMTKALPRGSARPRSLLRVEDVVDGLDDQLRLIEVDVVRALLGDHHLSLRG